MELSESHQKWRGSPSKQRPTQRSQHVIRFNKLKQQPGPASLYSRYLHPDCQDCFAAASDSQSQQSQISEALLPFQQRLIKSDRAKSALINYAERYQRSLLHQIIIGLNGAHDEIFIFHLQDVHTKAGSASTLVRTKRVLFVFPPLQLMPQSDGASRVRRLL